MAEIWDIIQSIDMALLNYIQANAKSPFLDAVMPFITHLASAGLIWIALAIILLCRKKYRRAGVTMSIALILCFIFCNVLIKNIVARERPFDINMMVNLIISKPDDFSFPSGHTTASFAAAASLLFAKKRRLGCLAMITAAAIAFSRLYLYVHFPSDVLCGIVLGIILAAIAHRITKEIYKNTRKIKSFFKDFIIKNIKMK